MTHHLLYGRHRIALSLPEEADVTVIRKPQMPILEFPVDAIRSALCNPIPAPGAARESLATRFAGAQSACVAICDITRPVPNGMFLRPIVELLVELGISIKRIVILVATGLHRPNEGAELAELVGDPWVLENVRVVNHDARCDSDHVDLGCTATRGTQVKLNRRFVEADVRIVTGLVEPHFMAGYSGGRKVIAPGLAHADTIMTFHNHAFMQNPSATNCNLLNNPLHEEQLEIVSMLGDVLALNTVIDEDRNLAMVNFGDVAESHAQAVEFVRSYCRVPVRKRFGTVLTSAAGYPLDKTYYQAIKGMVGAIDALQPGGNLIIASQCTEGLGSVEFVYAQRQLLELGVAGFLEKIAAKKRAEIDAWQTQMLTKALVAGKIYLYSTLTRDQQDLTGVHIVHNLDSTIRECVDASRDKSIAIIPEGPYVIPYFDGETAD